MIYVSLFVEILRARPRLMFWIAALSQAAIWTLVPTLFYAAPPGELPITLAAGHEFQFWTYLGPPLAYWLAEIVFRTGGLVGVYLLSQICIVVTYWAIFQFGCSLVGARHAIIAILLMIGISVFTVPTPDFGPPILAMPLWALALLHYWRAVGEQRPVYWLAAAVDVGLLLLTSYAGLMFLALILFFTFVTRSGRATFHTVYPWFAGLVIVVVLFPHLIWFDETQASLSLSMSLPARQGPENFRLLIYLFGGLLVAQAGLGVLVAFASNLPGLRREPAPVVERAPITLFGQTFVFYFALVPPVVAALIAMALGNNTPVGGAAPLLVMSPLAVVVAAGDRITLHHQHILGFAWAGLLLVPPTLAVIGLVSLPWIFATELRVSLPAKQMGQFFSENFERRTGKPLTIVAGDERMAALVALASPSRPHVFFDLAPEKSPWIGKRGIAEQGAVVVWPASGTAGAPPPEIKTVFPDLVPEIPRAFARRFQGRLSSVRIGWAMIRPQAPDAVSSPPHQ